MERPVVLCGLGRIGWRVFDHLRATGTPVAVLDLNADPADPRLAGVRFVKGDVRRAELLEQVGVADARGVVIVTGDDLVNVSVALTVRRLNPDARIVVRMFNQNLIPRFGAAVKNTVALSVSGLTAPLLALTALTGDSLGAFPLDGGTQQIAEIPVADGSDLAGRKLADVADQFKFLVVAHAPAGGQPRLWADVPGDTRLSVGDRVVACGAPHDLAPLLGAGRGELFPGSRWAGWVRRQVRPITKSVAAIDLPVKLAGSALFLTLFASTLVFRYGVGTAWADGLYQTVSIVATGGELHGENRPGWVKVFLSVLKLSGAALVAAFTAILTQYLIRARLGGAFESRRVPDGGHVVVCGLGNIGFRCVEELVRLGVKVVAVETVNDNPFAATVRRMGVAVIIGDATVPEVLRQANVGTARAVLAVTSSELANLEIGLLVREQNPAQRVVVRLTEPDFAQAVRDAADIKFAVSVSALAAPAFAAALFGDRVRTLVTVGGRPLAVVELTVQPNDPCLHEQSLRAAVIDYRFLPVAVSGRPPFTADGVPKGHRLKADDRLTVIAELPDLERLLRREPAPADWDVVVESYPVPARDGLLTLTRTNHGCSQEEAVQLVANPPFRLTNGVTRGEAEDLLSHVGREKVDARLAARSPPAAEGIKFGL